MKKIILGLLVMVFGYTSAQNYPDYYPNSSYDDGYYSDSDDQFYFPDDYYYEYPADYYNDDFYRSSYSDYRRSIDAVNWNRFFAQYQLAPWQIEQILYLNSMYASFGAWNNYYRFNPDRWYYDRFYALERILGARIFIIFQNTYYGGYSPVAYWRNYRMRHYAPVVFVMPRYRNININIYRVDRQRFHQNHGYFYSPSRQNFGFKNTPRQGNGGNWNNAGNEGFRSSAANGRNSQGVRNAAPRTTQNQGMRSGTVRSSDGNRMRTDNSGNRNSGNGMRNSQSQPQRNNSSEGMRKSSRQERIQQKSEAPARKSNSSGTRASGQRLATR